MTDEAPPPSTAGSSPPRPRPMPAPAKAFLGGGQAPEPVAAPDALREQLYTIIFEADTRAGRAFDIALLIVIALSVVAVSLESVADLQARYGRLLYGLEWVFTGLFTVEYALRIYSARRRLRYVFSFFGLVDVLSLLPTFLSLVFTGVQSLIVIRALRLLRLFRVLKVMRHLGEAHALMTAIRTSLPKISVFLGVVLIIAVIVGAMMYVIEDPKDGFTSVPRSMYWAIVTMTTVGYGDIAPKTTLGQSVAAVLMIIGYGIIAVPTGIVSAELVATKDSGLDPTACHECGTTGHLPGANFCSICGTSLE